ncbi:MAG: hypothetical protein LBC92_01905, partial [Rickettsiales bacterium]|nr:hypothetical protein [Rickettsiales bacterium]
MLSSKGGELDVFGNLFLNDLKQCGSDRDDIDISHFQNISLIRNQLLGIELLKKENDKNNDRSWTNLDKSCSTTDTHGNLSVLMQEIILSGVATLDTH